MLGCTDTDPISVSGADTDVNPSSDIGPTLTIDVLIQIPSSDQDYVFFTSHRLLNSSHSW